MNNRKIRLTNSSEANQDLTLFLARNEERMVTQKFFRMLDENQAEDPENFQVRETWVRQGAWCGQYRVVFGRHFLQRAEERTLTLYGEKSPIDIVMSQLSNEVLLHITDHPVYWDEDTRTVHAESNIQATAIIQDGCPFVVVLEAGDSYIYARTMLRKTTDMWFKKDTTVIRITSDGRIYEI